MYLKLCLSLYIKDLPIALDKLKSILFADDSIAYISSLSLETLVDTVNAELAILSDWFKANKGLLNVEKTKFTFYCKLRHTENIDIYILIDGHKVKNNHILNFLVLYLTRSLIGKHT